MYCFKLYLENGETYSSSSMTLENIKKIKIEMDANKEVYAIYEKLASGELIEVTI